jgi:hypothetical protein
MEPAFSAEWILRAYDLFLLYLAVLLAAFAGLSLLAYVTLLCAEWLSAPDSMRSAPSPPS